MTEATNALYLAICSYIRG